MGSATTDDVVDVTDGGPPDAAAAAATRRAQWRHAFEVDGVRGGPIRLDQLDRTQFRLGSKLVYLGETGLEGTLPEAIIDDLRVMEPGIVTDLGSVPGPARWFLGTYGEYTPAVIIHDRLIPAAEAGVEGLTDAQADRYLRFMVEAVGTRWLKRWIMWTAVALRSRFARGGLARLAILAWLVAFTIGTATLVWSLFDLRLDPASYGALVAPLLFAGLWGRQYGGGVLASLFAPLFVPPILLAALAYAVYVVIEWLFDRYLRLVGRAPKDPGTYLPEGAA